MAINARKTRKTIAAVVALVGVSLVAILAAGGNTPHTPTLRETVLKHETLIAECMHRRGFDYTAVVPASLAVEEARDTAVREHRDVQAAIREAQRNAPPDPNNTLVGKLPPDRQQAWGDALYGTDTSTGCYFQTYQAAWGADPATIASRGTQLVTRIESDPTVRAAQHTYVTCMAARGYQVRTPDDINAVIAQRREALDQPAGDAFADAAGAAQKLCVAPYNQVYNNVYQRLSAIPGT